MGCFLSTHDPVVKVTGKRKVAKVDIGEGRDGKELTREGADLQYGRNRRKCVNA